MYTSIMQFNIYIEREVDLSGKKFSHPKIYSAKNVASSIRVWLQNRRKLLPFTSGTFAE